MNELMNWNWEEITSIKCLTCIRDAVVIHNERNSFESFCIFIVFQPLLGSFMKRYHFVQKNIFDSTMWFSFCIEIEERFGI